MSDEFDDVQADISNSLAAELTGTLGVSDDAAVDQPLPDRLSDDVDDYDRHAADKGLEPEELVEEEAQQQTDGKVPLGALQKERIQRQQAQGHARELEQQNAQLMQQLAQFQQYQQQIAQAQQQQAQQAAVPDFDEDPRGYIEARERQFTEQLQNMQQAREYEQAAAQVQHRAQELSQFAAQAQFEFAEQNPDFNEASDVVHNNAAATLRQQYPGATDQQILATQAAAMFQFLDSCQRNGKNPAEAIFQRAQELGYTPGKHVPANRQPVRQPPTSLSSLSASGRAPDERGKVTAKDIANMPNDEFDRLFDSMRESGTQRPAV